MGVAAKITPRRASINWVAAAGRQQGTTAGGPQTQVRPPLLASRNAKYDPNSKPIRTAQSALTAAVTQQQSGESAGGLAVLKRNLAVDHRPAVAIGLLNTPPLAAGQVLGNL